MLCFQINLIVEDRVVWKGWVTDKLVGHHFWLKNPQMWEDTWIVPGNTLDRGKNWGWRMVREANTVNPAVLTPEWLASGPWLVVFTVKVGRQYSILCFQ